MADLPKAPQHEGVDPLTKGKKYQDGEDLKENSTFENTPTQAETEATERGEQTLADQEARNAEANTPTEPESTPDAEPEVEVTGNNEDGSVEANVDGEPTTLTPADEETQAAVAPEGDVDGEPAPESTGTEPDVATEPAQSELESAEIAENGTVGEGESEVADTAEAEQPTE